VARFLLESEAENLPRQAFIPASGFPFRLVDVNKLRSQNVLEIEYIANEGFRISSDSRTILVDALSNNTYGYLNTPETTFKLMMGGQPPYDRIDLLLFSHAHRDHFDPRMALNLLQRRPKTVLVGNDVLRNNLVREVGEDIKRIQTQLHVLTPQWGPILPVKVKGFDFFVVPVNHAEPGRQYMTMAFLFDLAGLKIFHFGDAVAESNLDYFKTYQLQNLNIDIALIGAFFMKDPVGQRIIKEFLRPKLIIPMHIRAEDIASTERELLKLYSNLVIFEETRDRKFFSVNE
jgi:L-ascorbate metabolism protein UlaG (beta-lactamase superfamily)